MHHHHYNERHVNPPPNSISPQLQAPRQSQSSSIARNCHTNSVLGIFFSVLSFNSKDGELYCAVMKEHKLQILLLPPVVFSRLKISKVYKLS
mmetsp:Transcript_10417/g.38688  ORF Transcript_10417/g.38688 Transcript_10417/m.38688 type:complete len:92 (+) Transcript_10417:910-1185(+)